MPRPPATDLVALRDALRERQAAQAREDAARAQALQQAQAEAQLFRRAAGAVAPLKPSARVPLAPAPPPPIAAQRQLDDARVLRESLSDAFDVTTLLDVDDAMSFRRAGVGLDVTRKLRAGHWSIQREIDLHGLRRDEAREALAGFVREAHRQGLRCVRVIHGKGLGSPGRTPVLKAKAQSWLVQKNEVLAFVQARADEGGAGALVVLLRPAA